VYTSQYGDVGELSNKRSEKNAQNKDNDYNYLPFMSRKLTEDMWNGLKHSGYVGKP
jgi:hypothetical protein